MCRALTAASPAMPIETSLPRIHDEIAWEFLRDEWDLLLAVGYGPTSVDTLSEATGVMPKELSVRLERLQSLGLVTRTAAGFGLVPALHVRQEGMGSFLKDLIIKRLEFGQELPFAVGCRTFDGGADGVGSVVTRANAELFPRLFERLQAPVGDAEAVAVSFIFAATSKPCGSSAPTPLEGFMTVLRSAAAEGIDDPQRQRSDLKVADTRNRMADVEDVVSLCDDFIATVSDAPASGAVAYALLVRPLRNTGNVTGIDTL